MRPFSLQTLFCLGTLVPTSVFAQTVTLEPQSQNDLPGYNRSIKGDISPEFIKEQTLANVVPESLIQIGDGSGFFPKHAVIVDKSARSLGVWAHENGIWKRVIHFPADVGKQQGDKKNWGDFKTPEGIYFFTGKREGKDLDFGNYGSLAFTTNYPNLFDQREGKTGSGIWLHAVPDSVPLTRGSRGCVVIRNDNIREIAKYIAINKTPIVIKDTEKYLTLDEWQTHRQELLQWLEGWKAAWESRDLDKYMSFYAENDFRAMKMSWEKWRLFKSKIAGLAQFIEVKVVQPVIYSHKNDFIIKFVQNYKSGVLQDVGEKTLYLSRRSGQWKIVSEEWKPIPTGELSASSQLVTTGAVDHN